MLINIEIPVNVVCVLEYGALKAKGHLFRPEFLCSNVMLDAQRILHWIPHSPVPKPANFIIGDPYLLKSNESAQTGIFVFPLLTSKGSP